MPEEKVSKLYNLYIPFAVIALCFLCAALWLSGGVELSSGTLWSVVFCLALSGVIVYRYNRSLARRSICYIGFTDNIRLPSSEPLMRGDEAEFNISVPVEDGLSYTLLKNPEWMKLSHGRLIVNVPEDADEGLYSFTIRVAEVAAARYADLKGGIYVVAGKTDSMAEGVIDGLEIGSDQPVDVTAGFLPDGLSVVRFRGKLGSVLNIFDTGKNPEFGMFTGGEKDEDETSLFEYVTMKRYGRFLIKKTLMSKTKIFGNRIVGDRYNIEIPDDGYVGMEMAVSAMMISDRPPVRAKGLIPVLFIHGYSSGAMGMGGGKSTWGGLPLMLDKDKYFVSEFRWRTSQRFQDAAKDLADSIGLIHSETGKKVHCIAHSFGGLLVRTYIQGLARDRAYGDDVADIVTFGTPHSGVCIEECRRFGAMLPMGQCFDMSITSQVSGFQAGLDIENMASSDIFGTEDESGYIPAMLCDFVHHRIPDGIKICNVIGLTNKDVTDEISEGDKVISYAGQRFAPMLTLRGTEPLLTDFKGFGGEVSETVLGAAGRDVRPGEHFIFTPDIYGYVHSPLMGRNKASEVYVKCAEGSECIHPAYILVRDWLHKNG